MSGHYIERCSCGVVLSQCRCPSTEKAERISTRPCTHEPVVRTDVVQQAPTLARHDVEGMFVARGVPCPRCGQTFTIEGRMKPTPAYGPDYFVSDAERLRDFRARANLLLMETDFDGVLSYADWGGRARALVCQLEEELRKQLRHQRRGCPSRDSVPGAPCVDGPEGRCVFCGD